MWVPLAGKSHIISNPTELHYFLALEGMEEYQGNWGTLEKCIPPRWFYNWTAIKYPYLHSGYSTKIRNCSENKSKYIKPSYHVSYNCFL